MAIDYSKFDDKVDLTALQKEVAEAPDTSDVPKGTYIVSIEKMEQKETKAGDKLMFAVQCRIKEGEHQGRMLFMNRVIYGNKTTEKWNDGRAIKGVLTWLEKLQTETTPEFVNYADFENCILDIYQEVKGKVELEVDYDAKAFNPISINEVYDL